MVVGAGIGIIYLVGNDITGIGIADNGAIIPLFPIIVDNACKIVS